MGHIASVLYNYWIYYSMFHACILCGESYGYTPLEDGFLHMVGKHLICNNCLSDLKKAMGILDIRLVDDKCRPECSTKDVFYE